MSSAVQVTCPTCHVAVLPGSAFCTRCGSALPGLTVITPVTVDDQQWGGRRRRDRGQEVAEDRPAADAAGAVTGGPGAGADPYGRPRPSHDTALGPAFDGAVPASVGRRLAAYGIDLVAVVVPALAVLLVTHRVPYAVLVALEVAVGLVVHEARSGTTPGAALLGLRVAKVETPFAPGLGRAAGRGSLLGSSHVLGVGPLLLIATGALDPTGRGRAWHDRAARTVVVDVRSLRDRPGSGEPAAVRAPEVRSAVPPPVADVRLGAGPAAEVESLRVPAEPPAAPVELRQASPVAVEPLRPAPAAVEPVEPSPVVVEPVEPSPVVVAPVEPSPVVVAPVRRAATAPEPGRAGAGPVPVPIPVAAAPAPAPEPQVRRAAASYVVTLDTGEAMTVSGPGYVGRRPQPPAGEACDHVIAIPDPGRSLSRTHARFGLDADGLWVEDCGSANGTAVAGPDGVAHSLAAGERRRVPDGGTVHLGRRSFSIRPLG